MNPSDSADARLRSARALYDLAVEFADRSMEAQARLLAEFSERAAELCADVGPILIDRDDDESLRLGTDGILSGEVLDQDTGAWRAVESPDEVVRYYDSTDVFLDLADALSDAYPALEADSGVDASDVAAVVDATTTTPPVSALNDTSLNPREPTTGDVGEEDTKPAAPPSESARPATVRVLEDLRRAGALSNVEFENLMSELDPGGSTHRSE